MSTHALLPTVQDLEKLPIRAVVAYAARTARRISVELHGLIADDTLEQSLRMVETVLTTVHIAELDTSSIIRASERVAGAYAVSPENTHSPTRFLVMSSLVQAALAAMRAVLAAEDPLNARHHLKRTVSAAERAIRTIRALPSDVGIAAAEAARRDYEILLREYGQHDDVVIGDPIVCFDDQ